MEPRNDGRFIMPKSGLEDEHARQYFHRSNLMFDQLTEPANNSAEPPPVPETPYKPYSHTPAQSEPPYKPYTEKPAAEPPYKPYTETPADGPPYKPYTNI